MKAQSGPVKEIAILNFTRFGDQIQTTPVLTGLRKRHPEARIHLIVKTFFRGITELLPCVDVLHEIDGDALARALSNPDLSFVEAYREVRRLIQPLLEKRFDLVFNFTHSGSSAVLLSMLRANETRGATLDRQGVRLVQDPWLRHMSTLVQARRLARFNLVDVYLGSADLLGCGERLSIPIPEGARGVAAALLPGDAPRMALQLGASDGVRAWSLERVAATFHELHRRLPELRVVLVGVKSEHPRAQALEKACPDLRVDNLLGKTEPGELGAVLERMRLLLTNDTGTMHLAAAVGTPTCSIFLGPAYPYETGPYAEGHWVVHSRISCAPCSHLVRCGFPVCHTDIAPEWLSEVCFRILAGGPVASVAPLPRADLLRSEFDEDGIWDLVPAHRRAPGPEDLLALAYRGAFCETLGGPQARPEQIWRRAAHRFGTDPNAWESSLPDDILPRLAECGRLAADSEQLALGLSSHPPDPFFLRQAGDRLAEAEQRIYSVIRAQPLLLPLAHSLDGELKGLPEGELSRIARQSAHSYRALERQASLLETTIRGPKRNGSIPSKEVSP